MKWSVFFLTLLLLGLFPSTQGNAAEPAKNLSLRQEVARSINLGVGWLLDQQQPDGHWGDPEHPALTALALMALQGQTDTSTSSRTSNAMVRARKFLIDSARPDGGIHRGQLANYNTALSLTALCLAKEPPPGLLVQKGRAFLVGLQMDEKTPGRIDSPLDGGIGYGSRYPHSDLNNTMTALEALYHSRRFEEKDQPGIKELNWEAVRNFIQSCQNLPSHNRESWASDDPAEKGGFIYFPGHSMAGETNRAGGRKTLRSYGSISYAGLLSYSYADFKKDDPRVKAVIDWLSRNYTLEENPGMGEQGLYYYYYLMTKALTAQGLPHLQVSADRKVDWRSEVALRLMNLQQTNHSWANQNARWWEKDPVLVSSYAILSLEMIWRQL